MKVKILQENLSKAISTVVRVVNFTPQLPILGNIFIKAQKTGVTFIGTNLETSIFLSVPAKIEKEGEVTIPARNFSEFVATLKAGKVSLSLQKDWLILEGKEGKAKFPTLPAGDFPVKEAPSSQSGAKLKMQLPAGALLEGLGKIVFAAAVDNERPALSGVFLEKKGKGVNFAATDGYRLSFLTLEGTVGNFSGPVIIPAKALRELERGMVKEADKVDCFLDQKGRQIFFSQGDFVLGVRLIEEKYPDFIKIIPGKGKTTVVVDRGDMERALRLGAIFARESANIIHLEIGKGKVAVVANAAQTGEGSFQVSGAQVEGEELTIAFNYRFLLEILSSLGVEKVKLELSGSLSPVKITIQEETSFLHIIMPVKSQA